MRRWRKLVRIPSANVLLETRFHDIRGIVVPGDVLAIGGGNVCGHGSMIFVSWLDINFIYSNFVTRTISVGPEGV
jgi:hypothetical protein